MSVTRATFTPISGLAPSVARLGLGRVRVGSADRSGIAVETRS
jgi:hypothetical protein